MKGNSIRPGAQEQFIPNTADKVILLKCKSDSVTFQLKTVIWFPISFEEGLRVFTMAYKVSYYLPATTMSRTLPATNLGHSGSATLASSLWLKHGHTLRAPATKFSWHLLSSQLAILLPKVHA